MCAHFADDNGSSRRFKTGTPKMPEAMKKSFQQQRERKILAAFDKEHRKQLEWTGFNEHNGFNITFIKVCH